MKKTREYYNLLFDAYGELLTSKEKEYFSNYYAEDLSLKEIAENVKVSRSAVQRRIKSTTSKLDILEKKLKVVEKNKLLKELLAKENLLEIKKGIEKIILK